MNLTSHIEEHPSAFYWCVGGTSTFMLGITAICWVRLVRARRSQLFLRNSLHPRKEEDQSLVRSTRAGPVGALTAAQGTSGGSKKSDVRDVDVHKAVEEQTGQTESSETGEAGAAEEDQKKKKKEKGGDHPMERKDGTTL